MTFRLPVVLIVLAGGCFTGGFTRRDEMMVAVREFNDGIRWGRIDQSAVHLPLDRRQPFADLYGGLEGDLEVVDYDIQRIDYDSSHEIADVRIDMSWSLKRRGIVERTVWQQHWERQGGGWLLTRQARLKGSPLALVDEPAKAKKTP